MTKVIFSVGEQEIIETLREEFGVTYIEACDQVIMQKREAAYMYSTQGNFDLAEQLLTDLGEWNDEIAKEYIARGRGKEKEVVRKIIIP